MFGKRKTSSALVESPASVATLKEILEELDQRSGEVRILRDGLHSAQEEIERLPLEEQELKDQMYQFAARALVRPELQAEADRCHEQMTACAKRRRELEPRITAIEQEIARVDQQIERLRDRQYRAKREVWGDILERLVGQFDDEQRELFLKTWTALDAIHNGAPAFGVLQRLGLPDQLETPTKLRLLDQLSEDFGVPKQ